MALEKHTGHTPPKPGSNPQKPGAMPMKPGMKPGQMPPSSPKKK